MGMDATLCMPAGTKEGIESLRGPMPRVVVGLDLDRDRRKELKSDRRLSDLGCSGRLLGVIAALASINDGRKLDGLIERTGGRGE